MRAWPGSGNFSTHARLEHRAFPRIVLDPGGLDGLSPNQGQFRYVSDLLEGLSRLQPAARFCVLGVHPTPPRELAGPFAADPSRWSYRYFPRPNGRGAMYREQVQLALLLRNLKADLYHGLHSILPVWSPCPVIATVYDLMHELFPGYEQAVRSRPYCLHRWVVRYHAQKIICISATTAADVARLWRILDSRLATIYLGTNLTDSASPPPPEQIPTGSAPNIVSPYNLEPRKNLGVLLRAFHRLLEDVPDARLTLYGRAAVTPEREAECERLLTSLGLGDRVARLGFVPDEQLTALYRAATLFVFPSLYEGFGYPVLEAMAAGACVVTRGASAMAEVVGDAGVFVGMTDAEELASTLGGLLRDDDRRARLGRAAQIRAGQFTIGRMAEDTLHTYEQALQRPIPRNGQEGVGS